MKKIFKVLIWVIVALFIAILLLPFLFKDDLMKALKTEINKNVNAEVNFSNVDLSFIKSFPNVGITLNDLKIVGKDAFANKTLTDIKSLNLNVNLSSLINKSVPYKINKIELEGAEVNIIVDKYGNFNYVIWNDTGDGSEASAFELNLSRYALTNSKLSYTDYQSNMMMRAENIEHSGKGNFNQDKFKLETVSNIPAFTFSQEGTTYFKNASLSGDINVEIDNTTQTYTLSDNKINLNGLDMKGEGFFKMLKSGVNMDVKVESLNETFASFLQVAPLVLADEVKNLETEGTATVVATAKGTYSAAPESFPAIDLQVKILNAAIKNNEYASKIEDVNTDIFVKAQDSKWDDLSINIPEFRAKVAGEPIVAKLLYKDVTTNPYIDVVAKGKIQLDEISKIVPLEGVKSMTGTIHPDFSIQAYEKDILNENYEAISFAGQLDLFDIKIDNEETPDLEIKSSTIKASPSTLTVSKLSGIIGNTDFLVDGEIKNPLAYFVSNKNMGGNINFSSKVLDLNEWMPEEAATTVAPAPNYDIDQNLLDQSTLNFTAKVDQVKYLDYDIKNISGKGSLNANKIAFQKTNGALEGSEFELSGEILNAYNFINTNDTLRGNLNISSKKMDLNKLLVEETETNTEEAITPRIPANIDIDISTAANELIYDTYNFKNWDGDIKIEYGAVAIKGASMDAMGGKMRLDGSYDSAPEIPEFAFKYNIDKFEFSQAFRDIVTFSKLTPIAEFLEGLFNSTLIMSGNLKDGFPDLTTLSASGYLETIDSQVKGFAPLEKLGSKLGVDEIKSFAIDNTKNWFEIENGVVTVKPQDYNFNGIKMTVGGNHNLENIMSYVAKLEVPRSLLKGSAIGSAANSGINFISGEASKLGINVAQGDYIYLDVNISGSFKNPTISIKPTGSGGKNMTDQAKDAITSKLNDVKEEYTEKAKEKVEEAKDSVKTVVTQRIDSAKTKVKEKVDTEVGRLKDKAKEKLDSTINNAVKDTIANQVRDKIGDVIGGQAKEEKDKLKDKLDDFNPFKKKKKKKEN